MAKQPQQPKEGQGAMDAIQSVMPGLSLSKILSDIGKEIKDQASHGSHEMASVLFRGDAFVMYPRSEQKEIPEPSPDLQQEQEFGGREL